MKICIVTTVGITQKYFYEPIAQRLCEMGNEVTLIAAFGTGFELKTSKIRYIDIEMKRGFSFSQFFSMPRILRKLFIANEFDIVCYSTPNASYYCSKALKGLTSFKLYFQFGLRYEGFRKRTLNYAISKFIEKETCSNSDAIRALTQKGVDELLSNNLISRDKNVGVISHGGIPGVDFHIFYPMPNNVKQALRQKMHISQSVQVIVAVSRLTKDKGTETLIDAFESLPIDDKTLIIVGDYDETNSISDKHRSIIKNDERIIVTGWISQECINEYLNIADVFVHASRREGFGEAVVEAMSCMLPVIACDIPGPSELFVNNESGLLVPRDDIGNLIQAISLVLNDKAFASYLAKNAYVVAKKRYDRNKVVVEICRLILSFQGKKK